MANDMNEDIFAEEPYGKLALAKIKPTDPNFRLYCVERVGDDGTLKCTGAIFREAKSGPNKGKLCMKVPGTDKTVYV